MITKLIVAFALFVLLVFLSGVVALIGWLTSMKGGEE